MAVVRVVSPREVRWGIKRIDSNVSRMGRTEIRWQVVGTKAGFVGGVWSRPLRSRKDAVRWLRQYLSGRATLLLLG
jgi:hypothetical protein